ncbi:MAG TPA: hypothetical protein VK864_08155 [Longimicrobiales bacterium]|nr:hypothetical protein [Longimicrobiales bacterium]
MFWWAWILIAWVVLFRLGRRRFRRRWYARGVWLNPGQRAWVLERGHRHARQWSYAQRVAVPAPARSPAEVRERAVAEARRRYVADEITVEEYEQALDQILRK